jgi:hypothetical protein
VHHGRLLNLGRYDLEAAADRIIWDSTAYPYGRHLAGGTDLDEDACADHDATFSTGALGGGGPHHLLKPNVRPGPQRLGLDTEALWPVAAERNVAPSPGSSHRQSPRSPWP